MSGLRRSSREARDRGKPPTSPPSEVARTDAQAHGPATVLRRAAVGWSVPAVPPVLRAGTALSVVVAVVVLVWLAATYHDTSAPGRLDRTLAVAASAVWPGGWKLLDLVDAVAAPVPALAVALLLALVCWLLQHRRLALVAGVGPLAAGVATTLVKPLVQRTIHGDNLAFPSGHTAFATAVALVLGLLVVGVARFGRILAALVLAGSAVILGTVMAVDQVVIGAHYPTDTIGGSCTAVVVVAVSALGVDAVADAVSRYVR